jgi:hypothetical protein
VLGLNAIERCLSTPTGVLSLLTLDAAALGSYMFFRVPNRARDRVRSGLAETSIRRPLRRKLRVARGRVPLVVETGSHHRHRFEPSTAHCE